LTGLQIKYTLDHSQKKQNATLLSLRVNNFLLRSNRIVNTALVSRASYRSMKVYSTYIAVKTTSDAKKYLIWTLKHRGEMIHYILYFSSIDYDVQLWDFSGMDASMRSFRTLRPCESHVIRSLEFSSTGDKLLVVPGSAQVYHISQKRVVPWSEPINKISSVTLCYVVYKHFDWPKMCTANQSA